MVGEKIMNRKKLLIIVLILTILSAGAVATIKLNKKTNTVKVPPVGMTIAKGAQPPPTVRTQETRAEANANLPKADKKGPCLSTDYQITTKSGAIFCTHGSE